MKSFSELMTGQLHEVILGAHDRWAPWSYSRNSWQVSPMKLFSELMTGEPHEVILGTHDRWAQWSYSRNSWQVSSMKLFSELMTGELNEVILGAHDRLAQWSHSPSSQDRWAYDRWQVSYKKVNSLSEIIRVVLPILILKLMKGQPNKSFLKFMNC
jgi:hypothetical protein